MRKVRLLFVTEVLDPRTGGTLEYPRMSDAWCGMMEEHGYIVTNTEREIPPVNEENQP
ncbi:hypothetical protein IVIADoCa2_10 [Xanthomonas phage vB_Xar_IVIA-DoCa2]|uniref:Uncharacterized protein n=1 Tax=Xanthomonas phage vB_Xar_IVIA-DoCa2 TaxID=2970491 RepID=A0A976XI99_9CAUD|nr:hypothetical protein IVIADoCa2_10 [Xanthomonas phage vB_Xar_IVIA-DoCa2]